MMACKLYPTNLYDLAKVMVYQMEPIQLDLYTKNKMIRWKKKTKNKILSNLEWQIWKCSIDKITTHAIDNLNEFDLLLYEMANGRQFFAVFLSYLT